MVDIIFRNVDPAMLPQIAALLTPTTQPELFEPPPPTWTPEMAETLLRDLPTRARQLIHLLIVHNGYIQASQMRGGGDSLRGLTGPITKAMQRLAKADKLPDGLPNPVTTLYDPDIRAYQKAIAFEMPRALSLVFTAALRQLTDGSNAAAVLDMPPAKEEPNERRS